MGFEAYQPVVVAVVVEVGPDIAIVGCCCIDFDTMSWGWPKKDGVWHCHWPR